MNKNFKIACIALGSLLISSTFLNCSDENPSVDVEEPSEKPGENPENEETGGGGFNIPDEVLEKVTAIYGQASIEPQEVKSVGQLAILTSICAARQVDGPISVTSAELNKEEITLVTLGGTEEKEGQATSMNESQLAAFGKSNDYLTAVTKLFTDHTIPQDKPVLITGISLGGMIAQQVLGVDAILKNFQIRGVITFGSPITLPLDRHEVKVVRFADTHDKVPVLGESILRMGVITSDLSKAELKEKLNELDTKEKIARTSKYSGMIETHALSYIEDKCWNDVDFLGDKEKKNVLVLKETMKFYPAPKQSNK